MARLAGFYQLALLAFAD